MLTNRTSVFFVLAIEKTHDKFHTIIRQNPCTRLDKVLKSFPMTCSSYIALRNHTPYSLLQGATPIPKIIERAVSYGMQALGLADPYLFGALEFSMACQKKSIQPIIGCQLSFMDSQSQAWPLVVYAKNEEGYSNLCCLISAATVNQPQALRGHVTLAQLSAHTRGLLALTGGPKGGIESLLERGYDAQAQIYLDQLCQLFPDHLYIELTRQEAAQKQEDISLSLTQWKNEDRLIEWAYAKGLPLIATQEVFFLDPQDYEAYDTLRCIALGHYIQDRTRPKPNAYHFLRSPQEMALLFQDIPEALANTHQLTQRCSFLLSPKKPSLPTFPCARSEKEELCDQGEKGLAQRLIHDVFPLHPASNHDTLEKDYMERLTYEMDMVIQMGFAGYFLIVSDFIRWAKSQSIPVGPGRGSGAGSLLAWCLSITDVDPMRFGLFFERFLNPERVSMPDFDVDFCQDRRDEVIAYVCEKYGHDCVAHIITFGSLQARVVLRDVGRVLQIPYGQVDKICKLIPQNPAHPVHLAQALELEPQLTEMAKQESQVEKLLAIGLKLEGLYRHASTHAAGLIISPKPLAPLVPLYQDEVATLPATQFSMKYVELAGLVKFDFLGLKTLTVLQTAIDLIKVNGKNMDLSRIPLDDPLTFALLCRVETIGLFQLESAGMSAVLRQLQPQGFEEIIALVALYRPGPMDDIPRYIACRHGREAISYAYPCLGEILKETFGVMVYQEQVLQIARTLAGYSLGGADLLRRAMGKKIQSEMDAQRKVFIEGTLANYGGTTQKASQFFDQIAKFAGYAFPKAHATPYGLLSYQTAYLKANYPVEFMTALMIHDAAHTDKLRVLVKEVQRMGLILLAPDINASLALFSVASENSIQYGLNAIKNIGASLMQRCVEEREKNGQFTSVFDFISRTADLGVNKKTIEGLICAGAFDALHGASQRHALMASVDLILSHGCQQNEGTRLFAASAVPEMRTPTPWSPYEALAHERTALGFYLTGHPLEMYLHLPVSLCDTVYTMKEQNASFLMMGMLMESKEKMSKSGQKYAFLHLSDPTGTYEGILFGEALNTARPFLVEGKPLLLHMQARYKDDQLRLTILQAQPLENAHFPEDFVLNLKDFSQVKKLSQTLQGLDEGKTTLFCTLVLTGDYPVKITFRLDKTYKVSPEVRSQWIQNHGEKK